MITLIVLLLVDREPRWLLAHRNAEEEGRLEAELTQLRNEHARQSKELDGRAGHERAAQLRTEIAELDKTLV